MRATTEPHNTAGKQTSLRKLLEEVAHGRPVADELEARDRSAWTIGGASAIHSDRDRNVFHDRNVEASEDDDEDVEYNVDRKPGSVRGDDGRCR